MTPWSPCINGVVCDLCAIFYDIQWQIVIPNKCWVKWEIIFFKKPAKNDEELMELLCDIWECCAAQKLIASWDRLTRRRGSNMSFDISLHIRSSVDVTPIIIDKLKIEEFSWYTRNFAWSTENCLESANCWMSCAWNDFSNSCSITKCHSVAGFAGCFVVSKVNPVPLSLILWLREFIGLGNTSLFIIVCCENICRLLTIRMWFIQHW